MTGDEQKSGLTQGVAVLNHPEHDQLYSGNLARYGGTLSGSAAAGALEYRSPEFHEPLMHLTEDPYLDVPIQEVTIDFDFSTLKT